MKKHLFFTCPTDHLELIIHQSFKDNNYYFTSLGNSVKFNDEILHEIKQLIQKHSIKEVSFVLSNNNSIIFDALEQQNLTGIDKLDNLCSEMRQYKLSLEKSWQLHNHQYLILSYYLNDRVKELQFRLNSLFGNLKIGAKIYNHQKNIFTEIYPDLISKESLILN